MGFNVLVVDDSAVMRRMITKALQMSGVALAEIHEAGNGREALDVVQAHWIDLALVDINMPVMNGEAFIEEVRSAPEMRDLAIVVVSTDRSETRIERMRQHGAAFVHKPFTPEALRGVIRQVTGVSDEDHGSGTVESDGFDF